MECVYTAKKRRDNGKKAVVLLSGGMDSATCAAMAVHKGYEVLALSVLYGQKHRVELNAAEAIARRLDISLFRLALPAETVSGSALTDADKALPTNRSLDDMQQAGVAPSYVPARNTILIALAAGFAESHEAEVIYYGAHREDHVGYPDCRPEFVQAMGLAVMLGTAARIRLKAPFIFKAKRDIVQAAHELGAPLELSHSCYQGLQPSCGVCDTCTVRIDAFRKAGFIDPIAYRKEIDWGKARAFA